MSEAERRTKALADVRSLARANAHMRKAWRELIEFDQSKDANTGVRASALAAEALTQLEQYTNRFPDVYHELARTYATRLPWQRQQPKPEDRVERLRRATAVGEALVRDFPTVTTFSSTLISHYRSLGYHLRSLGKSQEAEDCYRRVVELREGLARLPDASRGELVKTNGSRLDLARVLIANQKAEQARKELDACLAVVAELQDAQQPRRSSAYHYRNAARGLWAIHSNMAQALSLLGRGDEAKAHEKKAVEASQKWGRSWRR